MLVVFFIKLFTFYIPFHEVERKAKFRNRYNQVPHLTRDTICESEKKKPRHIDIGSHERSPTN